MRLKMRGTVSRLCPKTSGRASKTTSRRSCLPEKSWIHLVDLADGLSAQPGSLVLEVVTADRGDGGIAQSHLLDGFGDAAGLVPVVFLRLGRFDLAEVAPTSAVVTADEEGGLAILPALEDVGATSLLAHRVKITVDHSASHVTVLRAHRGPGADPAGFVLDGGLGVLDLDSEEPSTVCFDTHVGQFNCVHRSCEVSVNG